MQPERVTVLELCVARAQKVEPTFRLQGLVAGKTAAFITEWAKMMRQTKNPEPSVADFQRWANLSHRSSWYRIEDFRRLFPEETTPTRIGHLINDGLDRATLPTALVSA